MIEKKMVQTSEEKSKLWMLLSFLIGFVVVGGAAAWIVFAQDTDIHQRGYAPQRAISDVFLVLGMCGLPAGAITLIVAAAVRKGIKDGVWRRERPRG